MTQHHVIENPVAQILQNRADAVDVVIGAADPERAGVLENMAAGRQPLPRKPVVLGETGELIPGVVDAIHMRQVGTPEFLPQLQIIRRVGKDKINRFGWQRGQQVAAVALQDAIPRRLVIGNLCGRRSLAASRRAGSDRRRSGLSR